MNQFWRVVAHDLLGRVAQQAFSPLVEQGDQVVGANGHHTHLRGGIKDRLQHGRGACNFGLGLLAKRDVRIGCNEAAARHGRASHFQRYAVGSNALKYMERRVAGAFQNGLNHWFLVPRAVLSPVGVEANDALKRRAFLEKQLVREVKLGLKEVVLGNQTQLTVKGT